MDNIKREHLLIGMAAAAVVFIAGVGVLLYGLSQETNTPSTPQPATTEQAFDIPDVKPTPPPSLDEIADDLRADYPELADLLENPELGSVYKDFYLAYQNGGEPTALALARQRGILNDNDEIVVTVVLDTDDSANLIAELEAEGVIVNNHFRNLINIAIPLTLIREKAETEAPSEIIARISNLEHVIRLELPRKATKQQQSILGQGVNTTLADGWHAQGVTGQGVKVGVLDLGFAGHEALLGTELPDNVSIAAFGDEVNLDVEVHGTACAEIVHEMAPDAELYLAYYDGTDLAFGLAVTWLMEQGVDIISNSTGSSGLTPMDGTGFAAELVDEASQTGIFWVNAAGNEATSHYRGQFADVDDNTMHEFFEDTEVIPFIPYGPGYETSIILSWDDWQLADQDYDLILMDQEGTVLLESEDAQNGEAGSIPAEGFFYEFDDEEIYLLSIENYDGLARGDVTFDLFIQNGEFHPDYLVAEYSLGTPADALGAFAVGAVHWADDALESYSSQGPTTDGRIKPDITAPSVVDSASYSPEAFNGTSAAAPHVAGAAALVLQAQPDLRHQPEQLAQFLLNRTIDLGPAGPDNAYGIGRMTMGDPPEDAAPATKAGTEPTAIAELQPTSTPRPAPAVGLPEQVVGLPDPSNSPAQNNDSSGAISLIIFISLCLICFSAPLFLVFGVIAIILARRKR